MIHYITADGTGSVWVAAELQIIDREGIPFALHAMRLPYHKFFASAWAERMNRETRVLYPLPAGGMIVSILLAPFLFGTRFFGALLNALFGKRENFRARAAALSHFFVACHWARALRHEPSPVTLIHAQWIHAPGTIGMYGAWLLGVPFSFTGHAVDLFRDRVALADKVRRAKFIVCISNFHRDLYKKFGATDDKLHVVYCGIDISQYPERRRQRAANQPPRILSIGRLVEKKGFHLLIDACKILSDRGVPFECEIAGDGPLESQLKAQVERLGLVGKVIVTGKPVLQEQMSDFMASGDLFSQPCVWSKDNDVDGIPRTLMEAMCTGVPSVSTRIAGIPDVIDDGISGLLCEPDDVKSLADAMQRILQDAALANRLSEAGRQRIIQKFDVERCVHDLADVYRELLKSETSGATSTARAAVASPAHSARGAA